MTAALGNATVREVERLSPAASSAVRGPAYGVVAECLRLASAARTQHAVGRLFGIDPLPVDARRWYRSAISELDVAHTLSNLGSEWILLHPSRDGGAPPAMDYVVIGSPGVFAVSIKDHADQVVRIEEHTISVNGRRTNHLRDARLDAIALARSLDVGTVSSIVVIVNPKSLQHASTVTSARNLASPGDVTVVGSSALGPLLKRLSGRRSAVLDGRAMHDLVYRAEALGHWKPSATVNDETFAHEERFNRLRWEVSRAVQRRRVWFGLAALAVIAAIAAIVVNL